MLNFQQRIVKRAVDLFVSIVGLLLSCWLILLLYVISFIDTKKTGIISQKRIGYKGKFFRIYKIRTMKFVEGVYTSITVKNDPRITPFGAFLRKTKLDELPQLLNVLKGNMSLVGPRPDVPGFADELKGEERVILEVKPGITGPATLLFKNEEELLAQQEHPEKYNKEVIWPQKIAINMLYVKEYSLQKDIEYMFKTVCRFNA